MPNNPGVVSSVCTKWSKGTGGPSGSEHFNLVTQPTWPAEVAPTLNRGASGSGAPGYSNQELFAQGGGCLVPHAVPFTKAKRAQSTTDDETWVDGKVNPTISLFDQGDTRATTVAVAFTDAGQGQRIRPTDQSSETLRATKRGPYSDYYQAMTVRRLLPIECERLQAFPDNWTLIPWRGKPAEQCPDGPRYKALGNSFACNCVAWIGERIASAEATV